MTDNRFEEQTCQGWRITIPTPTIRGDFDQLHKIGCFEAYPEAKKMTDAMDSALNYMTGTMIEDDMRVSGLFLVDKQPNWGPLLPEEQDVRNILAYLKRQRTK